MEDKNSGFFAHHRKWEAAWFHPSNLTRKWTENEAFNYIQAQARYFCSEPVLLNDKLVIIPRGYFSTTVEHLSTVFRWNSRTAEKFLKRLGKCGYITRYKINPKMRKSYTLIKINNYNIEQPDISSKCTSKYKLKCNLNCIPQCTLYKKDKKRNNDKNVDKYGCFKNIFLTKEEDEQVKAIYGAKYNEAIDELSTYIEAKGVYYESHFAILSKSGWVYKKVMKETNICKKETKNGWSL